jgi:hypothetical protein
MIAGKRGWWAVVLPSVPLPVLLQVPGVRQEMDPGFSSMACRSYYRTGWYPGFLYRIHCRIYDPSLFCLSCADVNIVFPFG